MNKLLSFGLFFLISVQCTAQVNEKKTTPKVEFKNHGFKLSDYLTENPNLSKMVDSIYNSIDDTARVAQLIMPAIGKWGQTEEIINKLVNNRLIGGLLLLNGTKDQCIDWVSSYNSANIKNGALPFLYSADAEPTLFNKKISGTTPVKKANEQLSIEDVKAATTIISDELNAIGINYNFAPVLDMSTNTTVGYRGYGKNPANISPFSNEFIAVSQSKNIIATAKHFPGHGLVSGDTHKALQMINGELKEVKYYPPSIESGVLSIMIGHLAIKNNAAFNTNGLPATCSPKIVTNLLRDSLNFKGLIVTDAMNMGGVVNVPNANVLAIAAGCDIVLMPTNAERAHKEILAKLHADAQFRKKVEAASKRVIRAKICLGLLEDKN